MICFLNVLTDVYLNLVEIFNCFSQGHMQKHLQKKNYAQIKINRESKDNLPI